MTTETESESGFDQGSFDKLLLDGEALQELFRKALEEDRLFIGKDSWGKLGDNDTGVCCAIPGCKGTITEHREVKYLGDPRHMIIGPGGRDQVTLVTELYCSHCGISYHHLPKGV